MDDEESERQRKLKAGREKLLQFQQKKRGKKKRKPGTSKVDKSDSVQGEESKQLKHGADFSHANSEVEVSTASVNTDKDISSIASEVHCQETIQEHVKDLGVQSGEESGEESGAGSYTSGSYTSGEESYISEDGGVDDLVIANLERNELKNRTFELEEQLVAKKTALKDISNENTELKAKLNDIERANQGGHAGVILELNQKIDHLEKAVNEKHSTVNGLEKENSSLRKRIEEYQELDMSESSQVEELQGKLKKKEVTLSELSKQNEDLSRDVYNLRMQLNDTPKHDAVTEQLSMENENQRAMIKSLEDAFNQSKMQLFEFHKALQIKDQEINQLGNLKGYCESLKQNMIELNEKLVQKDTQVQAVSYDRDQKNWQASQEISRLQQLINENEHQHGPSNTQRIKEEYGSKISELMAQLAEKNSTLETMTSQFQQMIRHQEQREDELLLLKGRVQEQTEKLLSSQKELSSYSLAYNEKENKIGILEERMGSLLQVNEEISRNGEKLSRQMLELQHVLSNRNEKICHLEISLNEVSEEREVMKSEMLELQHVLSNRNEKICHLEISLSEVSEEREMMKSEMGKQSQELLEQIKYLRDELYESNTKVKEQSDEMDNSFSELHVTQDMIKDLQKEMLEKDLSLDNIRQKLQSTEMENKEALESLQVKFVREKEILQDELEGKVDKLDSLNASYFEIEQQLNNEEVSGVDLRTKLENLNAEVKKLRNEAVYLRNELNTKEQALNDLEDNFDQQTQKIHEDKRLKLELERVEEAFNGNVKITEKYEEDIKQLLLGVKEKESQIERLSNEVQERDLKIASLKTEGDKMLQQLKILQEQSTTIGQKYEEDVLNLKNNLEKQEKQTKSVEENLVMEIDQVQSKYQNELSSLKVKHNDEITKLREELDEKDREINSRNSHAESRYEENILKEKEQHVKERESLHQVNQELQGELQEAKLQFNNAVVNEEDILKEKEQHVKERESLHQVNQELQGKLQEAKLQLNDAAVNEENILKEKEQHVKERESLHQVNQELQGKLQEAKQQLNDAAVNEENILKEKEQHVKERESLHQVNQELQGKLQEAKQQLNDAAVDEENILSLKEQLQSQREKNEKTMEFVESLRLEKDELLSKELDWSRECENQLAKEIEQSNTIGHLNEKIKMLESELNKSQANEEQLLMEKEQYGELLENSEGTKQQEVLSLSEKLRYQEEEHKNESKMLHNKLLEEQITQDEFTKEKEELEELLKETEDKLREKEEERENEVKQLDDQLEQTRQVIENIRSDSEKKVTDLEESLCITKEELQIKFNLKEKEHEDHVVNMEKLLEEIQMELKKEKSDSVNIRKQLEDLVEEKELWTKERTAENFEQPPLLIEENVVASENWMETQAFEDDLPPLTNERSSSKPLGGELNGFAISMKTKTPRQNSMDDLDLLQQISLLKEKLSEKEKSELQLTEEKNKLLKIVKEYNESLANERDSLKEKLIDQDQTIQDLQDQLSTSELVSVDLQQVFGRQLLVLHEQRDSLLGELEEQKKERSSFVDILEEKHALEENLRSEKEQLADKLRQKEMLESQLDQERAALQEQLIRQARLNEIIREKDVLEEELIEQKNRLQLEFNAIETSLLEKEQLLHKEKESLESELVQKDLELHSWQGEFKTKEEQITQEREELEKVYRDTLLSTRTELEDTYQQSLQHLRTEIEVGFEKRLFEKETDFQSYHEEEVASLTRQHEQQVSGIEAEYKEKIANLKKILEEQRQKQVSTMKNVLERDKENEVEYLMDSHDSDMEQLRKELNVRHQDVVNAIVTRLKESHEKEMEDCLASAVTDTVLRVEKARLEIEQEYDGKFNELRQTTKIEIENLMKKQEKETEELRKKYQNELEEVKRLEKRNVDVTTEVDAEYEKRLESKLDELRKKMNEEHQRNIENLRDEIEMGYEDQMDTLQDELESKYDSSLRELREELDKQGHEITASAIEELQQKHFSEIDTMKSENEHVLEQLNIVNEKLEANYKEDVQELEEKLERAKEKLKAMEARMERMAAEWEKDGSERRDTLRNTTEQKISFLEQEHENKIADIQREMDKQLKDKDQGFVEASQRRQAAFDKEKMEMELKYVNELQDISADAERRISEKEQEHVGDINKLQQTILLLREESEETRFQEVNDSRQQLSEKYQKDLENIVRVLKLQHQKAINNLISEAESNQINNENEEFEKWKKVELIKHSKEMNELRNEHQIELQTIRKQLEEDRNEEIANVNSSLSAKNTKDIEELRQKLTTEYEEELNKRKIEKQSRHEKDITNLSAENELMKQQHDEALKDLNGKLTETFAREMEAMKKELRLYKNLVEEKDVEIENIKRDHQKELKNLKQRHFDDLLEEVSQIRSDLALDAAREVELVKIESDYKLNRKVKELHDIHVKQVTVLAAQLELMEKEKESLNEFLRLHAQETLELKSQLENEKAELSQTHNEAMQDLKTKLDVEQQNVLNELKVQMMVDMNAIKENESKEREEILNSLKEDHSREFAELRERLKRDNDSAMEALKLNNEIKMQEIEETFSMELKSEKEKLENEKEKDMAAYIENINESIIEKHGLQLQSVNEQHIKELEALREELVKTHMEKFTLMTEQLEQAHEEELEQVRESVLENSRQEFETKVKQAEEVARYNLEQEHLEGLKELEENLQKKHEIQMITLNNVLKDHQRELEKLNEIHEVEKENSINELQKLKDESINEENKHDQEMMIMNQQLEKAETDLKHRVLEIETMKFNEMTAFVETTSAEYEERLKKIRQEFEEKLEEIKSNVDSSNDEKIQELLSKQHAEELERLKEEHGKHLQLINNELESTHALKAQIQEESEQKLLQSTTKATEQEQVLKRQLSELDQRLVESETDNQEMKVKNENILKELEEKEKDFNQLQEKKQAVDMDFRTVEENLRETMNRHDRERLEDLNQIRMLKADLNALNSERENIQRARDNVVRLLSKAVRTTLITEETISSRLETLFEQTMQEDDTISDVNSISENEDSIREDFRQRTLPSSTPAVRPFGAHALEDDGEDDDQRTLTDEKQAESSIASDEGLELSAVLSDSIIQGSLDTQNEETVVDSGNRLKTAVKKLLDMVLSVTNQLNVARGAQDELLNTTAQRTIELNQLTHAQEALMLHLQEEMERKEEMTNRLRKAEEDMEGHLAEIERLEILLKENDNEKKPDENSVEKDILVLKKDKAELQNKVESFKSKTEEMEKSYEKEKEDLSEKIVELQQQLSQMEGEVENKKDVETELQKSEATHREVVKERDELLEIINDGLLETVVSGDKDELQAVVESLKDECLNKETENTELKETKQKLQTEVVNLKQSKQELENKLRDEGEEFMKQIQEYVEELKHLKYALVERQRSVPEVKESVPEEKESVPEEKEMVADRDEQSNAGYNEMVEENELLRKEVNTLETTIKSLTNNLEQSSNEKGVLEKTFEEREESWEEEKNTLQQQLYDSCLEASSFKERLNKSKNNAESVTELEELVSARNEAYKKLENTALNLEEMVNGLKESVNLKEEEIDNQGEEIDELNQTLATQKNILDEQRDLLTQAENTKISDEEKMSYLKDALMEAQKKVDEGEVKMQEILTNMKNLEDTYKAQTSQAMQQLNKKVDVLQKELRETKVKLDQQKQESNIIMAHHIADLKQDHAEEIMSLRTQFEIEIQDAVKRTKNDLQKYHDRNTKETHGDYSTEWQETISDSGDSVITTRLNRAVMEVNGFTETIAGYLSEFSPLEQNSFHQHDASDNSTSKKINTIVDDVKMEADAIYDLVNNLPAFYDPNVKSLQMAWREEKEILIQAIKQLKEIAIQRPEEPSSEKDWRATILRAVLDFLNKEEEMLTSELQAMEMLTRTDAMATSKLIEKRQQKQEELHRQSVERLYQTDRISLMNELCELQKTLTSVKEELMRENNKLQEQLKSIQKQVQKREKEFLQQVASKDTLLRQERDAINELHAEREIAENRFHEANDLLTRERLLVKDLQDLLNKNKTRLKLLEAAVEKEKSQTAVIQTCLESERTRCSNLEQALKRERLNIESREREVEEKNKCLQDKSVEEQQDIEKLKTIALEGKQQLSKLQAQLQQEKARVVKLKKEIVNQQNISASNNDKLGTIIKDLREERESEKSRNAELAKSLDEERNVSEELKSTLVSVNGVNEQITEQEKLITDLSEALEKERRVNEELRDALDNEYEIFNKTDDDRQLNVVKELQTSLTAVQNQLQNQIEVVDQERSRGKRLRKERDIHEATALGARDKEKQLLKELEKERNAREREIESLKNALEKEITEKKDFGEIMEQRNREFEVLCKELQRMKGEKKTQQSPTSPSRERLNILRYDIKSLIDEHRVLLILHKDYLVEQTKSTSNSTSEVRNLRSRVESLLNEMDRVKIQLGTISTDGSAIPLSPIKAAAYDRISKQNRELADYVAKLTEEKAELRSTLSHLELKISHYQEIEAKNDEKSQRNKQELESLLVDERSRSVQDRLMFHENVEGQKRRINEMERKLRDKESELDQTKRVVSDVEDELERNKASVKRLQSAEIHFARWTPARIQKLYGRYMRAEKSRKSLTYQKKYLILLLGGFRKSETQTLSLIAKMGAYPSFLQPSARFSSAFTKFRVAVRVVIATKRMEFLVKKSKNSIRQVIEPKDATEVQKTNSSDLKYGSRKTRDPYKSSSPSHVSFHQNTSSKPLAVTNGESNNYKQHSFNSESKDISFVDALPSNKNPVDYKTYPRDDYKTYQPSTNIYDPVSTASFLPISSSRETSNEPETSNERSFYHSPPVRERVSRYHATQSGLRQPFSTSFQTRSFPGEVQHDPDPPFDSQDLDRKIQTLDNLQQKLSLTRESSGRTRRF